MIESILYPGLLTANWQMLNSERMALLGLLAQLRPRNALEVGVFHGGSLSLMARFAQRVWACDIDPAVPGRFAIPPNVDLRIGAAESVLTDLLAELDRDGIALDLVLIDADHSAEGVRRDVERVLGRAIRPTGPHVHRDARQRQSRVPPRNGQCRLGRLPLRARGRTRSGSSQIRGDEVWGGLALAYLDAQPRQGQLVISAEAADTVHALQRATRTVVAN